MKCLGVLLQALLLAHGMALAEPGVSSQKLVLGMSTPLSGPLAPYGLELQRGLNLGFAQANASGGVAGRQIDLLVRDDAGLPERAVLNTQELLATGVLALTGYHGSASIEAALPLWDEAAVPVIGVASGTEDLRVPVRPALFNLRAGARDESVAMVLQLDTIGLADIAIITQDDAAGRAALHTFNTELVRLAILPTARAQLPLAASDAAVAQAVQVVCKKSPQALVMALDARSTVAVIRQAKKQACTQQFYVMSEAGSQMLASTAAPRELAGVIVSQVLPNPSSSSPLAVEFQRQSTLAGKANPSYAAFEGYLYAVVITEALKRCAKDLTRRCLVTALEARPLDMGGYRLQFSPTDHRGSRFVEMTIVTPDGRFRR